jgi:hypothetical protein
MKNVSQQTTDAWLSGVYTGNTRAAVRATISKLQVLSVPVDATVATGEADRLTGQLYTSVIFGQTFKPIELPNIVSLEWQRSAEDSVATATIVLRNNAPSMVGQSRTPGTYVAGDYGYPGWYTWNRGVNDNPWGLTPTGWQDVIIPDRVIHTYEGYGVDYNVAPELDPHMYPSGVWLIDAVEYSGDTITLRCRDLSRILIDHLWMPPVIPAAQYPLNFEAYNVETIPGEKRMEVASGWFRPTYSWDSGIPWFGYGTPVFGHLGVHAFDGDLNSYWLSMGNAQPNAPYSFEWIEGQFSPGPVTAVRCKVVGGPYVVYISVFANGAWQGNSKVPYDPHHWASYPNGSDIPFVMTLNASSDQLIDVVLPQAYSNVTKVRFTFTNLWNSGMRASTTAGGGKYPYRAAVSDIQVSGATATIVPGTEDKQIQHGNYGDLTDIVLLVLAYAGWYWPKSDQQAFITRSDGTRVTILPDADHPMLGQGRVWADFEYTGITSGGNLGEFRSDEFDKQPLMDCIQKIREIVGFNFFVDERGGAVFRPMNVWALGNYVQAVNPYSTSQGDRYGRVTDIVEISDSEVLSEISVTLASTNVREKVFVSGIDGGGADGLLRGAVVNGWNPAPSGFRRVAGWTDKNFTSAEEAVVMADMIALRQMFRYRTNSVVIPGYPGITVDDQVKLLERITNETYVHYVRTIQSSFDAASGKWTYTLETQWLGEDPLGTGVWAFNLTDLAPETVEYLKALGVIPKDTVVTIPQGDIPLPTGSGGGATPPGAGDHKGYLTGLVAQTGAYDSLITPMIKGYVYEVDWATAQPTQGDPIQASVVTALQGQNAQAVSAGLDVRLRIRAGSNAPAWAKSINGFTPLQAAGGTVGPFWREDYLAAYRDFITKLAAVVGPLARFKEVTVSGHTTTSADPFDKGWDDMSAEERAAFVAAGYSAAACNQAFLSQIDDHLATFVPQGISCAMFFGRYRMLDETTGGVVNRDDITYDVMTYMTGRLGKFAVVMADEVGDNATGSDRLMINGREYKDLWNKVASYRTAGSGVSFRTMTIATMKTRTSAAPTPYGTAALCASSLRANSVEMPVGWHNDTTVAPTGNADPSKDYKVSPTEASTLNAGFSGGSLSTAPAQSTAIGSFQKPSAANTGAKGTLTTVYGRQDITTPGAVVENLDVVNGIINIIAANVTVRNCRVRGYNTPPNNLYGLIDCPGNNYQGAVIEDCTLYMAYPALNCDAIRGRNFTARRCDISNVTDGFGVFDHLEPSAPANVLLESNYVHDLWCHAPDPAHANDKWDNNRTHNDCIQIQGNGFVTIRGNTFNSNPSPQSNISTSVSCVMITPNVSPAPNILIENNWFYGAEDHAIINAQPKGTTGTSAIVRNNRFGHGLHDGQAFNLAASMNFPGLPTKTGPDTQNGNVYDDTGQPVTVVRLVGY